MIHSFSLPRVLDQSEYNTTEDERSAQPGHECVRLHLAPYARPFLATFLPELSCPRCVGGRFGRGMAHVAASCACLPFHSCPKYYYLNFNHEEYNHPFLKLVSYMNSANLDALAQRVFHLKCVTCLTLVFTNGGCSRIGHIVVQNRNVGSFCSQPFFSYAECKRKPMKQV